MRTDDFLLEAPHFVMGIDTGVAFGIESRMCYISLPEERHVGPGRQAAEQVRMQFRREFQEIGLELLDEGVLRVFGLKRSDEFVVLDEFEEP